MLVFLPQGQALPNLHLPNPTESLVTGKRYLLLLHADPQTVEMTAEYELDGTKTYYRATGGMRGALPLPTGDATYQAVATVCNAVKTANAQAKISALRQAASSADPLIQQAAQAALRLIDHGRR